MICFVTGATGFIGSNLVHELLARGHSVKALVRPGSDVRALAGAEYETVEGDLSDRDKLRDALYGCDWCFHVAASYRLWMPNYKSMFATNVDGTRTVIEAANAMGCSRIIYTSTVGCIGLPKEENKKIIPSDETILVTEKDMTNPYKLSKWKAEQAAQELARKGAPVVIVNPTAPIGPRDVKPTPTGQMVVDFLNRSMPAYIDTGLNFVHVRDVAIAHILAAERGRLGERYILGNAEGNLTLKEALDLLAEVTGLRAPRIKMPHFVAMGAARANAAFSAVTRIPPKIPLAGVRMAKHKMFFTPAKAIRVLGMPQTPVKDALADAAEWFKKNGYVKKG